MLVYVPIPLSRVLIGKTLPVDVWTPQGRLLLRRGQQLQSEAHRDMLCAHHASMTEADASAWQKSLERSMRQMRAAGVGMLIIAQAPMPEEILEIDYLEGHQVDGGWLDLQELLRVLLYQGAQASSPLPRLQGIEQKAAALLKLDPDEAMFVLFQALPDLNLGYCATHALLAGAVAALTAVKLARSEDSPALLLRAALVMNIGMARPQDSLARQHTPPNPSQRQIIVDHPPTSSEMLRGFGLNDDALLQLVQWHHAPDATSLTADQQTLLRLLNLADGMVAKMAPRSSRPAMLPLGAARSLLQATSPGTADLRPAMAAVLGFYPPGTYVQLANGDIAVVIKRGHNARAPHVASVMNAKGMPLSKYVYHDTRDAGFEVRQPWASAAVHIRISLDKVRRLRLQQEV
jgi:hypothetical protein